MTRDVRLGPVDLSRLMPLHLVVDAEGMILSAGPTLARMRAPRPVEGVRFFDVFAVRRPHGAATMADLSARGGDRLALEFRAAPRTQLKGHFVTDWHGLFVFDLSFGIKVNEVVSTYGLKATDFAPTSLAVEILYLVEANAAVAAELRKLNCRLQQARVAAERLARTDDLTGCAIGTAGRPPSPTWPPRACPSASFTSISTSSRRSTTASGMRQGIWSSSRSPAFSKERPGRAIS